MKIQILHESKGRMRVRLLQPRMTLTQADQVELWLGSLDGVTRATVHERTCCAIIQYQGSRETVISALNHFSYEKQEVSLPVHSSRALNRTYEEKLVGMTAFKAVRSLFFPAPLRATYAIFRSVPYLFRGVKCLWDRKLQVEVLDGLSISISMLRGNFDTASSVMFLLGLGELLEEWTHKKSMEDLAACMALNVDRVWLQTEQGEILTPISQIQTGDRIVVRMGGMIPLDGVICEGEAMLNQASLTGESVPVAKHPGSLVYAGTVVMAERSLCLEMESMTLRLCPQRMQVSPSATELQSQGKLQMLPYQQKICVSWFACGKSPRLLKAASTLTIVL